MCVLALCGVPEAKRAVAEVEHGGGKIEGEKLGATSRRFFFFFFFLVSF